MSNPDLIQHLVVDDEMRAAGTLRALSLDSQDSLSPKSGNQRELKEEQEQKKEEDERLVAENNKSEKEVAKTTPENNDGTSQKSRKLLKQKKEAELKGKFEINLWINGKSYEHGMSCTFCTTEVAILHCQECEDFFCYDCDSRNHEVKKRRHHISELNFNITIFLA